MSRFRPIIALLMLALWLPASSHAALEAAHLIHHEPETEHSHSDSPSDSETPHEAADGFCIIPSGVLHIVKNLQSFVSFSTPVLHLEVVCATGNPASLQVELASYGPSPPLLAKGWQFIQRTALSVRAPSVS